VIVGNTAWRSDEEYGIEPFDFLEDLLAGEFQEIADTALQDFAIARFALHMLESDPGLRVLDTAQEFGSRHGWPMTFDGFHAGAYFANVGVDVSIGPVGVLP
jgi:hypothetical protein